MGLIPIKKGLDIPVSGQPIQEIREKKQCTKVALLGPDYIGLKAKLFVEEGDFVKLGQVLFTDKNNPQVKFTSPGAGRIHSINRGARRALVSIVLDLLDHDEISFPPLSNEEIETLDRDKIVKQLIDSGLWVSLKSRPFGRIANPQITPHSLFVTAMDTNPLAPSTEVILKGNEDFFNLGLTILAKLTPGWLFLCKSPKLGLTTPAIPTLKIEEFSGPHPAGNVGTHIHFLDPVNLKKVVWHIGIQDVIAVGYLFSRGQIPVERIISLAGPAVKHPRLLKIRMGAAIAEIIQDELKPGDQRVISGSLLSGRSAQPKTNFLGRYHQAVTALPEGNKRQFLGWLSPGTNKYSLIPVFLAHFSKKKHFPFSTSTHGSPRALIPIGNYEKVMPLDILPTLLFRSLLAEDIEEAEKLGCLELEEEDLALCSFVCPSKIEFGPILRKNLEQIHQELL